MGYEEPRPLLMPEAKAHSVSGLFLSIVFVSANHFRELLQEASAGVQDSDLQVIS